MTEQQMSQQRKPRPYTSRFITLQSKEVDAIRDDLIKAAEEGVIQAFGSPQQSHKCDNGAPLIPIPAEHWYLAETDDDNGLLYPTDHDQFYMRVQFLRSEIDDLFYDISDNTKKNRGNRQSRPGTDVFWAHVVKNYHFQGLPSGRGDLINRMTDLAAELECAPDQTTIARRADILMEVFSLPDPDAVPAEDAASLTKRS
jgi:hypothetical protein